MSLCEQDKEGHMIKRKRVVLKHQLEVKLEVQPLVTGNQ